MGLKDFIKKIGASIEAHTLIEELEADLRLIDGDRAGAKAAELEFTRFKSGDSEFEIEIKTRAAIPEGEGAVVTIHGIEVARVTMRKLQTEVIFDSRKGDEVPPIKVGDQADLLHNGVVIAAGTFVVDD
jgi:hypothetical protein